MNLLKSGLRYFTPFRNTKATNKGESADFAHCKNWLPWQHPLSHRKKKVKSVIDNQISTIWYKIGKKNGPVDPEIICLKSLF